LRRTKLRHCLCFHPLGPILNRQHHNTYILGFASVPTGSFFFPLLLVSAFQTMITTTLPLSFYTSALCLGRPLITNSHKHNCQSVSLCPLCFQPLRQCSKHCILSNILGRRSPGLLPLLPLLLSLLTATRICISVVSSIQALWLEQRRQTAETISNARYSASSELSSPSLEPRSTR
jgi:hypothetical protein